MGKKKDLRQFDYVVLARLETEMWQVYYKRQYLRLFVLVLRLFWRQFGGGPLTTLRLAYYSSLAAADYRKNTGNENYPRVLKNLAKFFKIVSQHSLESFDYFKAADLELRWWDIHRYANKHRTTLEQGLAEAAAVMRGIEPKETMDYARFRTKAILMRDHQSDVEKIEPDWAKIEELLREAWRSLRKVVQKDS